MIVMDVEDDDDDMMIHTHIPEKQSVWTYHQLLLQLQQYVEMLIALQHHLPLLQ